MAGFIGVKSIVKQFLRGPLALYVGAIMRYEAEATPGYSEYTAENSLSGSSVKAMIIHSVDDPTVSYKKHFVPLQKALRGNDRVVFVTVSGKSHNPNFTHSAVKLKDEFFALREMKIRAGELSTAEGKAEFLKGFDFAAMTEQDEEVFAKIFEFLKK